MAVAALVSVEEYLASTFHPDCDYVDGRILERNVGKKRHSHAQGYAYAWFWNQRNQLQLEPYVEQRLQVAEGRFRIPDLLLVRLPVPDEEIFTKPPYVCLEVMSPDDTMSSLQDRLDDYHTSVRSSRIRSSSTRVSSVTVIPTKRSRAGGPSRIQKRENSRATSLFHET